MFWLSQWKKLCLGAFDHKLVLINNHFPEVDKVTEKAKNSPCFGRSIVAPSFLTFARANDLFPKREFPAVQEQVKFLYWWERGNFHKSICKKDDHKKLTSNEDISMTQGLIWSLNIFKEVLLFYQYMPVLAEKLKICLTTFSKYTPL